MKKIKSLLFLFLVFAINSFSSEDVKYIELLKDQNFYFNDDVVFTGNTGDKLEVTEVTDCKDGVSICYEVMRDDGQLGYVKEDRIKENHKIFDEDMNEIKTVIPETVVNVDQNSSDSVVDDTNSTAVSVDVNDTNATIQSNSDEVVEDKERKFSRFEKTFIYHRAYNRYLQAMELMYANKHKEAYAQAIIAKDIFKNQKDNKIALPYMPGYVRESAQTPRRIYYKIIKEQNYELTRLIRKIKLLSPPIPMVVLNQTSTYIDITVQNVGDTPLDKFGIEINYENVVTFNKIDPNESKTFRYNKAIPIEQITFSEEYGFAPMPIEFETEKGE